jgi:hypothetical protein
VPPVFPGALHDDGRAHDGRITIVAPDSRKALSRERRTAGQTRAGGDAGLADSCSMSVFATRECTVVVSADTFPIVR